MAAQRSGDVVTEIKGPVARIAYITSIGEAIQVLADAPFVSVGVVEGYALALLRHLGADPGVAEGLAAFAERRAPDFSGARA
jgi:hypothetical protein